MGYQDLIDAVNDGRISVNEILDAIELAGGVNKRLLASKLLGVDPGVIIQEMFMGYKQRKQRKQLYSEDNTIPTTLIKMYYELGDRIPFESLKSSFVSRYIKNECKLEDVHSADEVEGMRAMYEFIHSSDCDFMFDVWTLKFIHQSLYSTTPHPEFGGEFRTWDVYLPGTGTELTEWSMIRPELKRLDPEIQELVASAENVMFSEDADLLLDYLDKAVVIGCKLIKIHPFGDGNGRAVRGFTNKLLEYAGLPPIYIKENERTEYHKAMNKANNEGDYTDIKNFYRYKVCDSIVELDINPRVRKQMNGTPEYGPYPDEKGQVKVKVNNLPKKNDD